MHRRAVALSLFLAAPAWGAGAAPQSPAPAQKGQAVHEGIAVEFQADPLQRSPGHPLTEGDDTAVRFKISDQSTGNPLSGVYPSAWLDLLRPDESAEAKCVPRVGELLGSDLFNRPALDLNVYYVLALNEDATISVVDPRFGFGGSKLLSMVELDGPGEDWVLSPDKTRLYVSTPDSGRVAVVDAASWKVIARIELGGHPRRLALQPDGSYLWAALDDGGVAAVHAADLTVAARIATGAGPHDLAVSDDGRFVFVTNRGARTLSIVDAAKLARERDVPLGMAPSSVSFSPLAKTAYVASEEDGTIVAVAADREEPVARIQTAPGLGAVRFAPGGRFALVPNPRANRVFILDAAAGRLIQTAEVEGGPDQIDFSDTLAYVRRRDSGVLMMIPLLQIGEAGKPVPLVDTPGGESPFGKVSRPSPSDSIVRAPGETAVLIANPGDRSIYYYEEGMAAPLGSFSNYDREPRAVLVVDRTLKERRPGLYETVVKAPPPGRYRVAFFLDAPRTVHCFELTVAASPELEAKRLREAPARVQPLMADRTAAAGRPVPLRFLLTDPGTGKPLDGLKDVTIMLFQSPGNWQHREPGRQVAPGTYEAEIAPPEPGRYQAAVQCGSRHLPFHLSPAVEIDVVPAGAAAPSP